MAVVTGNSPTSAFYDLINNEVSDAIRSAPNGVPIGSALVSSKFVSVAGIPFVGSPQAGALASYSFAVYDLQAKVAVAKVTIQYFDAWSVEVCTFFPGSDTPTASKKFPTTSPGLPGAIGTWIWGEAIAWWTSSASAPQ